MRKLLTLRIILWSALALTTVVLLWLAIAPGGNITYQYDFAHRNDFIQLLTPADRLQLPAHGQQQIIGSPVYFNLRTARRFDQAKVTITFKNDNQHLPLVELGVLSDKTVWRYARQPLQNKTIDGLAKAWVNVRQDDLLLLQRQSKYAGLDDFLLNRPAAGSIAQYNYELKDDRPLKNYSASAAETMLDCQLIGDYQFYTYLDNEPLNFKFYLQDRNLNKQADEAVISVYDNANQLVMSQTLPDDGITDASGHLSAERIVIINKNFLAKGVYKVEVHAPSDIVTNKIITSQQRLSFINKLTIGPSCSQAKIFTDSLIISAQTINPASLQAIKVDDKVLNLDATYKIISLPTKPGVKMLTLAKNDIMLSGNGVFGFAAGQLINPSLTKVDELFKLTPAINYILARYRQPQTVDGWTESTAVFDLSSAYREQGRYSFMLAIPGLLTEDNIDDKVTIKSIKVELTGKSVLKYIFKK